LIEAHWEVGVVRRIVFGRCVQVVPNIGVKTSQWVRPISPRSEPSFRPR
jgi:hypothetical protein